MTKPVCPFDGTGRLWAVASLRLCIKSASGPITARAGSYEFHSNFPHDEQTTLQDNGFPRIHLCNLRNLWIGFIRRLRRLTQIEDKT
jgi:hypothetical protein